MLKYKFVSFVLVLFLFSSQTTGSDLREIITTQVSEIIKQLNVKNISLDEYPYNPDYDLTTIEIVHKYGYHGEVHHVTTEDGYILEMHRVNSKGVLPYRKHPIILMHGALCASSDFVLAGPQRGLAYLLADRGYDVWLGNARGNKYSLNHTYLSLNSRTYWDFSFHEMGVRDLPSMIDYVLEKTFTKEVIYIGHSQGSAVFNVMASELPQYNKKVRSVVALAPLGHMQYLKSSTFQVLAHITEALHWIMEFFGEYSFKPTGTLMKYIKSLLCEPLSLTQPICKAVIFSLCGYSESQMDKELLPLLLNHLPAGASTKQIRHLAQVYLAGKFRKFDYGYQKNLWEYDSPVPPMYDLSYVRTDTHLFYSDSDWIATTEDTQMLHNNLPNSKKYRVECDEFNHLDFLWGLDVRTLVYEKIFRILAVYNN